MNLTEKSRDEILNEYIKLQNKYREVYLVKDKLENDNKKLICRLDYNTEKTIQNQQSRIEKLESDLGNYKTLSNKGNVYNTESTVELYPFQKLFYKALSSKYTDDVIQKYMRFSLEQDEETGDLVRTFQKQLSMGHYLSLSRQLGKKYFEEFNTCSSRYKGEVNISDTIKGRVGLYNEYPEHYKDVIIEYENKIPLNTWGDLPKHITKVDNKLKCNLCDKTFKYSSMKTHLTKSVKHLKHLQKT